ncbi:serine/Threonine protein kinase [Microseira wollei NIES-4236]|uniref:Serine/Threonine protein kinase n=1 Tax=Microseira wollei NIES-4236 TaxID=2530354 RepID=A0AAV3WGW1_9CYAN|nr:serine/Threonine protein kinase [Microseira wollei NIES-4236]
MSEFLQTILRPIWELLVPIPMPWRALIILLLLMPALSWLFWRAFPCLLAKLSQLFFICTEVVAKLLLWLENLVTQSVRKRGSQPPNVIYIFDDLIGGIVLLVNAATQKLDKIFRYALTQRWLPRKGWFVTAAILLPFLWYVRPILGETTVAKFINSGLMWWDSFEGWVLTGKWIPYTLSRPSPEQFVRDYFSAINNGQYSAAWNLLTPEYQRTGPGSYNEYLDWWERKVERVEINQLSQFSQDLKYATVDVRLQYFMKRTQKLSKPESVRYFLIWDIQTGTWLINDSKYL